MSTDTYIKLKGYIQPFEKLLAKEELLALTSKQKYTPKFTEMPLDSVEINPEYTDVLQKKSAYWESITNSNSYTLPTYQVMFEKSPDDLVNIIEFMDYPKRRYLRYGVHDLHEYRGKFFPQLVRSLINISQIPEKSKILEPFSGSGTTACESNMLNMDCTGIDLNPLSILISETKSKLLRENPEKLYLSAQNLIEQIKNSNIVFTEENLKKLWSDKDFKYLSDWFPLDCLKEIAFILDNIKIENNLVFYNFFKICLSNIIRSVSYQKESDLRVRKEIYEYKSGFAIEEFIKQIGYQLDKIIPFIKTKDTLNISVGVSEIINSSINEIEVDSSNQEQYDLLITSPPYATALPYLDTDRLSLIVLGLLPRSEHKNTDLKMIGNREITERQRLDLWNYYQKRKEELPTSVVEMVNSIAEINHQEGIGFRRRNLPALLAKYFLDMLDSMARSYKMMKNDTYAFYIVGNNSTLLDGTKVIIPTDRLLFEIGKLVGWQQYAFVDMELLASRDIFQSNSGNAESILVFYKEVKKKRINSGGIDRKAIYSNEKFDSSNEWDFSDANSSKGLHSIHPYPAKFIPEIPKKAILEWTKPNDIVLDPFCGSGTTLLEALRNGRNAVGIDNNSVACLISEAKTLNYTKDDLELLSKFLIKLESIKSNDIEKLDRIVPEYKNLEYWFSEEAISELGAINYLINNEQAIVKKLLTAIFSSIIVNVSYQDSDTRYSRKIYEYDKGKALQQFKTKLKKVINNIEKEAFDHTNKSKVFHIDGRDLSFLENESIDLIITSPPYLNAYDYHKYHRHRIHWIDGDVSLARDYEIGKHDTFTRPNATPDKYFEDMNQCFIEWFRLLKHGSKLCIVIGDAVVNKTPVAVADKFIEQLIHIGFEFNKRWIRNIKTTNKSFNQNARMDQEHVLLFNKLAHESNDS
ncbi:DNA methyltransferase [Lysinibacillus sp. OF-1]|uniref:DNA methyltransferase n=1 Tax=Lysinibacillus sp. OF-1 TaxID=2972483 RepID=UPI00232A8E97|nr:DNA methyltransferase [Lysinibacillus sp. OF-1]WCH47016.1 site-specific DNA-methyltransferase [Lysinibacillus sp. OF-1]